MFASLLVAVTTAGTTGVCSCPVDWIGGWHLRLGFLPLYFGNIGKSKIIGKYSDFFSFKNRDFWRTSPRNSESGGRVPHPPAAATPMALCHFVRCDACPGAELSERASALRAVCTKLDVVTRAASGCKNCDLHLNQKDLANLAICIFRRNSTKQVVNCFQLCQHPLGVAIGRR